MGTHNGAKRKGTKATKLTAKKAARKRVRAAKLRAERQERQVVSDRMQAKQEAREAALDQIALDKLNGLEEGKVCRRHYQKLCSRERPRMRPVPRRGRARPASSYRHARRTDMARRRAEQYARSSETLPLQAVIYKQSREMARRVRQRQAPAAAMRLAA